MKITKPTFSLTNKVNIIVVRGEPDKIVNGRPVKGSLVTVEIEANVQPLKFTEVMSLPEVERTKEWIKVYSAEMMRTLKEGSSGHQADIIQWDGKSYRVLKCHHYRMGVLDHYVSYACLEFTGAGYEI